MAPPMAAEALGRPAFSIGDLMAELRWPDAAVDVGLVETAGGVRSPLAADGDCLALCAAVAPDWLSWWPTRGWERSTRSHSP